MYTVMCKLHVRCSLYTLTHADSLRFSHQVVKLLLRGKEGTASQARQRGGQVHELGTVASIHCIQHTTVGFLCVHVYGVHT